MILAPSLACADPLRAANDMNALAAGGAGMWHIDIMDGHYAPNLCLSFDFAQAVKCCEPHLPMDVHLMTSRPFDWLERLDALRPEYAAFHIDATPFSVRFIQRLRALGIRPGAAINPSQPLCVLEELLPLVDYVLLMAVEPGFSGQSMQPAAPERVRALAAARSARGLSFKIMVDGGVNHQNGPALTRLGADILVGGAFVCFGQPDGAQSSCKRFISACAQRADVKEAT